jgi:zinc protease
MVMFGLPENYFDTYRKNITSVTTANVLDAARAHVDPDKLQVVIVGNPEIIRKPVEQLSFGPLSVREASET